MTKNNIIIEETNKEFDLKEETELVHIDAYSNPKLWMSENNGNYQCEFLGFKLLRTDSLFRAYVTEEGLLYQSFQTFAIIPVKKQREIIANWYSTEFYTFLNNQRLINYRSARLLEQDTPNTADFRNAVAVLTKPSVEMLEDINAPYLFMGENYNSFSEEVTESQQIIDNYLGTCDSKGENMQSVLVKRH